MISKRFSLLFFLKKSKNNFNGEAVIYIRITIDQQRAELSTKRVCDPKRWNSHTGRLNGTKEDARTINAYLDTLQSKVYEVHRSLIEANETVTADAVKNKLTGVTDRPRFLLELFRQHTQQMQKLIESQEYARGTLDHFETTYDHVHCS
jgi:DNA repair ATPase RecN